MNQSRAILASILLFNFFTFAQESASEDVEEVIVTAQKKEERYVDVPVSVTTVSGEQLEIARVGYVQELVAAAPSVTYNRTAGMRGDGIYIRGIGTSLFQSGVEPTVSAVLDGVVLGRTYNFLANLVDIERVEILRGPQGTLFGKNASGGAINIVTKDPTAESSTELYYTLGSNEEQNFTAVLNGELSDNLLGSLTIFNKNREGFIKNEFYKLDKSVEEFMNGNESEGFRGKLLWNLDDGAEILFVADYENQYRTGIAATLRSMPAPGFIDADPVATNAACGVVPSEENTSTCMNNPAFSELEHSGFSMTYTRELNNHVLKSITSARESYIGTEQDVDNHWDAPWTVGIPRNGGFSETTQFTQEFQLTNIESMNGIDYTGGFFYFEQELFRNFNRRVTWPAIGFDGTGYFNSTVDSTNWAIYGDFTREITDSLDLIAGLRYTNDELSYDFDRPTGPIIIPNIGPYKGSDSGSDNNVSGRIGLKYNYDADSMLFATYSTGYKSPGWDIIFEMTPQVAARGSVEAETSTNMEFGLKTKVLNDTMLLGVTYFDSTFDNYQQQSFIEDILQFRLANVGKISTSGWEVDLFGSPTQNLTLNAGIALVDAVVDSWSGAQCYAGQTEALGCVGGVQDLAGAEVPLSPDFKASFGFRYDVPIENGDNIFLTGSYRYQDEFQSNWNQYPNSIVGAYQLFNGSIGYESGNFSVEAFVRNVFDEFYVNNYTSGGLLGDQMYLNQDHKKLLGVNFKYTIFGN